MERRKECWLQVQYFIKFRYSENRLHFILVMTEILTYLIHSPKDRSNIVPTLGFKPESLTRVEIHCSTVITQQ